MRVAKQLVIIFSVPCRVEEIKRIAALERVTTACAALHRSAGDVHGVGCQESGFAN